ncbi:transporter [Dyadobacter luticola]|uniref:Transporter n=1 Tax=Dyadobacter luticola TaxID=1979387 RepID=A0A5R9L4N8_9BACT|nr:transporter [Dyadobacter luticola]TLV03388.1 transporter [Dyadobacter luticola]
MKKFLSLTFAVALTSLLSFKTLAQGCVAIRSTGNACMLAHADSTDHQQWILTTSGRYFKSFRHYSGTEENKDRLKQHTEVINHTASIDINLTRILNDRWSIMIDLPVISNARSSLYEHGLINGVNKFNERHSTHSFGVGDMRIAAYHWLFDPKKSTRGNIQVGLGIKLPTGDYDYQDYWHNVGPNGSKELRTVDQSIQLGDGGTGFTVEANMYRNITHNFGVYANFYYLVNPREQNGVRTYRETLTPRLANEAIMSVPDQYMARGGVSYAIRHNLTFAAGARLEGIPVHDIVGGSGDFRRPGYVWSIEPSLNYQVNKVSIFVSVPVALARNRTQSVTDKENSVTYGTYIRGDAAFADYSVNAGISFKF